MTLRTRSGRLPVRLSRTNLMTNPNFRSTSSTVEIRRNYARDPAVAALTYFTTIGNTPAAATNTLDTTTVHNGGSSYKRAYTGSGQGGLCAVTDSSLRVNAGESLAVSLWVYSTVAATATVYAEGTKVSDGSYSGIGAQTGTVSVPANTWTKVTGVCTNNGADMMVNRAGCYNMTVNAGDVQYFDEFLVEKASAILPYFDGGTTATNGLTYAWTGTANTSMSTATGNRPTNITNGSAYANSTYGMVVPAYKATNTDTYVSLVGDIGAVQPPLVAGKTFTVSATAMASASDASEDASRARSLTIYYKTPTTGYQSISSAKAPIGSEGRISVTATIPPDASEAFIRFYNGSSGLKRDVTFRDVLIEEGSVAGAAFDGAEQDSATFTYRWTGSADASTSEELKKTSLQVKQPDGSWRALTERKAKTNYIPTPSFDNSAAFNYTPAFVTFAVDNTTGYLGSSSGLITRTAAGVLNASLNGATIFLNPGDTFTFSIWHKNTASSQMPLIFHWVNAYGQIISQPQIPLPANVANWTKFTLTATAPAGTVRCNFAALIYGSGGAVGEKWWFDAATWEKSYQLGDYFDGSMAADSDYTYSWSGAVGNSASIATPR